MGFVLPTTYARTRIYRPRKESVALVSLKSAEIQQVCVRTHDGLLLHGWHALSRAGGDGPRPLVLYFPGASGHRGYRIIELELFARLGCDVLLVDYRGYAENAGQPSERSQTRDARSVWRFATDELAVGAEQIVIFGESIGGAVGIRLAAELCRQQQVPAGIILQATFACMLDVVSQFFPRFLANLFLIDRYPSVRRIRQVSCPILSIHGDQDRLIPIEMGRRLFDAAPPTSAGGLPKEFLKLPGVDHNDILDEASAQVETTLARFLQQTVFISARDDEAPGARRSDLMQPLP